MGPKSIAFATSLQVANALVAPATVADMGEREIQAHRIKRLAAMVEREGGKAKTGRKLGYRDGAFIGQMLRGERPITEKTVLAVHALSGYMGWMDAPVGDARDRPLGGVDVTASGNMPLIPGSASGNTFKRAPVIAWARLGDDLRKPNENWPAEAMRVIYSTKPMSGLVKWVEVMDDLLAPRVLRGDIVVVDPEGKPMVDSPVLVRLSDGTHVLRFYRPLAGDAFEVFDGAGRTMDSVRHGIVVAATFVTLSRDSV